MGFIEELTWRGMIHDIMPGTKEQLEKEQTTAYVGFDPTAKSLHIGNLATIMLLKHFQIAGHKPIALVGGATGMVGDPSGKASERQFLSEEVLKENQEAIKKQLSNFLDFHSKTNPAELVNNYDWFKEISFLQFLRDAGKFISINYMSSKDSVKSRLKTGISFTEFSYQLLQGYDYYWLYKNKDVKLQMGGSDQWGNITTGTELIRRKENQEDENADYSAFALTTPLVTKADGTKFGKSESGNVWLDPNLTSPYEFYQFWINQSDEDCPKLIKVFTLYNQDEINNLIENHNAAPHLRILQGALADDVTERVHGKDALIKAQQATEVLFGKATLETLMDLDEDTFKSVFKGVPQSSISKSDFNSSTSIVDLISVETNGEIYSSKGEAKRAIKGNAVSVNKKKINDENYPLNDLVLLNNKYLLIGKGKKNHIIEVIEKA